MNQVDQFVVLAFDHTGQAIGLDPQAHPVAAVSELLGAEGRRVRVRTESGQEADGLAYDAASAAQGDEEEAVEAVASSDRLSAWDLLCPRAQTLVLAMSDLLSLLPCAELAYTEDNAERVLVGICDAGSESLDPVVGITCHPDDAYSALLSLLQRLGHVLHSPEWRG